MPSSPFDETPDGEAASTPMPKRRRRPWWRWNLITLAISLFALVWLRNLFWRSITYEMALVVGAVMIALWSFLPLLLLPNWLTATPSASADRREAVHEHVNIRRWINWPVVVCRILAVLLALLSCVHLAFGFLALQEFDDVSRPLYRNIQEPDRAYLAWTLHASLCIVLPLFELLVAASLFVLTEIALRLGSLQRDMNRQA